VTDDEFIESFQDCSLAVECFHHADHVRMAFLHLSRYPPLQAIQRFSHSLAKFAAGTRQAHALARDDHLGLPAVDSGADGAGGASTDAG
jgi:N-formylglutamate deformylase